MVSNITINYYKDLNKLTMKSYKITNITNLLGKREYKYNTTLELDYVDGLIKKKIKIKAGDSINLSIEALPLSVHRLRVKNLIIVNEIKKEDGLYKKMGSI